MDPLCQYRVTDIYLTAALSIAAVSLFVCLKPRAPWSEERYLRALVLGWALLQIVALILSSIQDSNKVEFPQAIAVSIHVILATISLWGIAIVQVSPSSLYFEVF